MLNKKSFSHPAAIDPGFVVNETSVFRFRDNLKMKLYALSVLHKDVKSKTLVAAFDLQSFGYFQRSRYVMLQYEIFSFRLLKMI